MDEGGRDGGFHFFYPLILKEDIYRISLKNMKMLILVLIILFQLSLNSLM